VDRGGGTESAVVVMSTATRITVDLTRLRRYADAALSAAHDAHADPGILAGRATLAARAVHDLADAAVALRARHHQAVDALRDIARTSTDPIARIRAEQALTRPAIVPNPRPAQEV
jgi:hypothetical protein